MRSRREKVKASLRDGEFVFDPEDMTDGLMELRELTDKGLVPVCALCGTPLDFALSPAQAGQKNVAPGVSCPKNLNHCQISVTFAREND